jgi:hypothetical protein
MIMALVPVVPFSDVSRTRQHKDFGWLLTIKWINLLIEHVIIIVCELNRNRT